jgi:type IV secretory pathway VirB10-like protein
MSDADQTQATRDALRAKSEQTLAPDQQQHPRLFYVLVLAVAAVLFVGLLVYFRTPSPEHAAVVDQPHPSDTHYGQDDDTPPPIVTKRRTEPSVTATPAPGITTAPNAATANTGSQQVPQVYSTPVGPRLVTVYQNTGQGGSAPTAAMDVTGTAGGGGGQMNAMYGQLATLRDSIIKEEAEHGVSGGDGSTGAAPAAASGAGAYGAPQQTAATYADAGGQSGGDPGRINTPFYRPTGDCTLPMTRHWPVLLVPSVDSSSPGTITAYITEDLHDPRSGALCIPKSTSILGRYIGLAQGAGHLGATWTWIQYPDLCRRPLTNVETTDQEGTSGLAGRVNTHLFQQLRDSFFGSIVNAAGQIIASAVSRGNSQLVYGGGGGVSVTPPNQQEYLPTLYEGQATPFTLLLSADYTIARPYVGDGSCY